MAEKRFVFIEKGEGKYCQFYSEWYDECSFYMDRKGTEHCKNCKKGFTRTEAIDRMSRELCENVYGSFWENASEQEKQNSLIYAESAFDALITEVK